MSSAAIEQKHAQALCGSEKGRAYAGDDHEAEPYLPKNDPKYAAITESQRKMAEPVEVKGQALASDEPICMVSVTVLYISSGTVCFSQQQTGIQGRIVYALSLYRGGSAGSTASSSSGIGLFL